VELQNVVVALGIKERRNHLDIHLNKLVLAEQSNKYPIPLTLLANFGGKNWQAVQSGTSFWAVKLQ
jgi:hypothetical protein